ncbi:hypothetical protein [Chondromyces apiculatus]|uniref:Uncharacterized protein n=1 Tax=Chondromyces apiculatus DSM 436 TaxID=1192034 RepID=A0A017SZP3_9BACT|nr:hypothetical protein [Chondromyces apiculatus]EYF01786.1 Hypothetical protein CAP_7852 [Chondromyces apiculatus DSM 436]
MKTMVSAMVGNVFVLLHSEGPPSDEEWSKYINQLKTMKDLSKVRSIAFTDGGAPNSRQRKDVNDILKGRPGLAAVVSYNSLVRGVVTALNWFNPAVKTFSPDKLAEAYEYMKLTRDEIFNVNKAIEELHVELGFRLKCSPPKPQFR